MKDRAYFEAGDCDLATFAEITTRKLKPMDVPLAADISLNVPIYDMQTLRPSLADPARRQALMGEWAHVLGQSAGALVLRGAYSVTTPIDAATKAYETIIEQERGRAGGADHFATAGANDRIWNSLQKLCETSPETFALYFGNDAIAAVCEAWLGAGYQMTAQVNLVRPGGKAQTAHRDYHLGFQTEEVAKRFPAHIHDLSAAMTLQGAIAHCDMPLESGPTKLLPFSQLFRPGYLAYRHPEFAEYFEANYIQLPLAKGDALFFNPALFHGAGENRSADIHRMANLLQISSPFGRAMEVIDRDGMCRKLYPVVQRLMADGRLDEARKRAAIAASAEGYSFPTNLDTDPPVGGLAPETQAALFERALAESMTPEQFMTALDAHGARRHA
ncbi:ectoine hydroxylase-related dioxygenase (phytanoyl-CoA dioxygenase family) [Litoreibacter meonggei]|uniref:Ectoine hydroxylase-related dioxygenase (Phytanoyl-CoA dioxygenase family) n=1 Tax=Litoreibacter meonggei TaxID=1049199 RepID=A0A497X4G4_9RHOB|nr:phytanoyl-CoA dioxygenase family protein [Litoreibacter meonggei]RLJ60109.1 ectoine hydroxylase-related dioxygenase (phytanoyl-CoA dioxygenase family) [Litoreibacter meonggei]